MDIPPSLPLPQAAFEDFFNRMFQDILAGRVTTESMLLVFGFFGFFFLLAALSILFGKTSGGFIPDHPLTWVTSAKRISQLLDAAVTQRSKVRVSFHHGDKPTRSTDGTLVEAGKDYLVLELSSVRNVNNTWIGRSLELNFRLRLPDQPKVQSAFAFSSAIKGFRKNKEEVVQLAVTRPERLELNQNRMHLRVDVPEKYVQGLQFWPEEAVKRVGDPKDPDTWGEPLYAFSRDGEKDITLENLSGGGLRVEMHPEGLHKKGPAIALGAHYFLRTTLEDMDFQGRRTHYLLVRVVKCYDDCDSKTELSVGFNFIGQGTPLRPPLTGLSWVGVNRDFGVLDLDDWAYSLHLELYRNRGEA